MANEREAEGLCLFSLTILFVISTNRALAELNLHHAVDFRPLLSPSPLCRVALISTPRGSQLDAACPFYLGTAYLLLHRHAYSFHFCHLAPFFQPPPVSPFSPFGFLSPALSIGDLLPGCSARCHSLCLVDLLLPQSITKEGNYTTAYAKLEVQPPLHLGINLRCDLPVLFADCYEVIAGLEETYTEVMKRADVKTIVLIGSGVKFSGGFNINVFSSIVYNARFRNKVYA
ncbi:uncharacterized protein LOC144572764 [Carex rostrata]